MPKSKIHLIIAHPNKSSFNYALADLAKTHLEKLGCEIIISDLYDLDKLNHPAVKPYQYKRTTQELALIKSEQDKIKNSQITLVQFPLYWYTVPGILKNYMDSVWEIGFAFGPGIFKESPLCDGRKVLLSFTTGAAETEFSEKGSMGNIEKTLYPIELSFKYIGYEILPYFAGYYAEKSSAEKLEEMKDLFISHLDKHI